MANAGRERPERKSSVFGPETTTGRASGRLLDGEVGCLGTGCQAGHGARVAPVSDTAAVDRAGPDRVSGRPRTPCGAGV